MTKVAENRRGSSFLAEVIENTPGGERIVHCLQCGSCGGSCPNGADMQHTPRAVIAMINANKRQEVLSTNTPWCCVSCYFCTSRCPQEIPITDIMYCLKRLSIREGLAQNTDATALAKTFTDLLDKYGRSFELGIATRYLLFKKPFSLLRMGPMGMGMMTRGRMAMFPTRIKNIEQLQAIIQKARQLGERTS
ncbi:MAG: 4Fe-4S dicluster domain-containing protein [Pirellulales bacterium]|nr:4Fe-4S dicluster domain-containing protein [Pirellulales bacterium]